MLPQGFVKGFLLTQFSLTRLILSISEASLKREKFLLIFTGILLRIEFSAFLHVVLFDLSEELLHLWVKRIVLFALHLVLETFDVLLKLSNLVLNLAHFSFLLRLYLCHLGPDLLQLSFEQPFLLSLSGCFLLSFANLLLQGDSKRS